MNSITAHFRVVVPLFLSATAILAGPVSFTGRPTIYVGQAVSTVAQFNKDGRADIFSAGLTPNSTTGYAQVSILLNNGTGAYSPGPVFDLGFSGVPSAIVVGDFNNDGLTDIAVLIPSYPSSELLIAFQHKNGSFTILPIPIAESTSSTLNMAVADFNRDNNLDLAIPTQGGVVVLLNQGNERFATPVLADTSPASFVVTTDLNGDKKPDLVVGSDFCCSGNVIVVLGDGAGGFYTPVAQPYLPVASRIAVADFNGDGKPDIVGASSSGVSELYLALGNGDGTFGTPETIAFPNGASAGISAVAGDFNGDGRQDVGALAGGNGGYELLTFLNAGGGYLGTPSSAPVGVSSYVALADINGDGHLDALVTNQANGVLASVLLGQGNGNLLDGTLLATPFAISYMVAGDFAGAGGMDLVEVNGNTGLTVYVNTGKDSNLFEPKTSLPYFTGPLITGDFNRDGRLDLVVVNGTNGETLLGNGYGGFELKPGSFSLGNLNFGAAVAVDMNGDGKLDLVTGVPSVALGNGDGSFQTPFQSIYYCYGVPTVSVADANRDGKPDVLTLCDGQMELSLGNGDGTLQTPVQPVYTYNVEAAIFADFNGDGIPDIAFSSEFYLPNSTGSDVTILLGNGDGTFRQGTTVVVPSQQGVYLVASDFNGDGKMDLAALDPIDAAVVVFAGNGDGTLQNPVYTGTASNPSCFLAASFHIPLRAGKPDIAACTAQGISLLFNNSH